jgi:hypothetical protein
LARRYLHQHAVEVSCCTSHPSTGVATPRWGCAHTEGIWWPKRGGTLGWVLSALGPRDRGSDPPWGRRAGVPESESDTAFREGLSKSRPSSGSQGSTIAHSSHECCSPRPCMNPLRSWCLSALSAGCRHRPTAYPYPTVLLREERTAQLSGVQEGPMGSSPDT